MPVRLFSLVSPTFLSISIFASTCWLYIGTSPLKVAVQSIELRAGICSQLHRSLRILMCDLMIFLPHSSEIRQILQPLNFHVVQSESDKELVSNKLFKSCTEVISHTPNLKFCAFYLIGSNIFSVSQTFSASNRPLTNKFVTHDECSISVAMFS